MKNLTLILLLLVSSFTFSQQYEYKIISVIESVVPNGLGRSRMLLKQSLLIINQLRL